MVINVSHLQVKKSSFWTKLNDTVQIVEKESYEKIAQISQHIEEMKSIQSNEEKK
jgi:hypothetical protein